MPIDKYRLGLSSDRTIDEKMGTTPVGVSTDSIYNKLMTPLGLTSGAFAAWLLHRNALKNSPDYAEKAYKLAVKFEERSPFSWGKTFGISERLSSYVAGTKEPLKFVREDIVSASGDLTKLGEHFQRQFGDAYKIKTGSDFEDLTFSRISSNDPYLRFDQHPNLKVRFTDAEGKLAGISYRYHGPLESRPIGLTNFGNLKDNVIKNFRKIQYSQAPGWHPHASILKRVGKLDEDLPAFLPYHTMANEANLNLTGLFKQGIKNYGTRYDMRFLGALERGQKLMSELGVGVKAGTWNKAFHIPGFGSGGLLNEIVGKRVLPIIAGVTALRYIDYKLGHKPSNAILNIGLKANVFRAQLTDLIPGARKITDTYAEVVPGPQYGPLALPLAGAFAGGLYHYSRVVRGFYSDDVARKAAARVLPSLAELKGLTSPISGVKNIWKNLGIPGKGMLIGLAAMAALVPGMLGSRKHPVELQQEYSGQKDIAVRSGRQWSIGTSPWKGSRIVEWRPHAAVLYKNRTHMKSLYGSEEEYWKHNPILHPLRWLHDPYWLESKNYSDRPYPVTSPAFSNVPLIGPLLAATIGKLIKPVVRMHEDEWDGDNYVLFNKRLEPRGPTVESKFERLVLAELAKKGYKAQTQVKADNYRIDFVVGNDKHKLAIEADGATYHTPWTAKADAERQSKLESEGWHFQRVLSTDFFENPDAAMDPVYKKLASMGIKPEAIDDRDPNTGLIGLAPAPLDKEFNLKNTIFREHMQASEFVGLPGYIERTIKDKLFPPKDNKLPVYFEGSREMDSWARQYFEKEIGEGTGPSPTGEGSLFGYTEPLRRFIQPEGRILKANEIRNTMPSWLPGEEYNVNFKKGDGFTKIQEGYARLPGAGYESLHPEVAGVNPEDYPDINKFEILADVAPYSNQYTNLRKRLDSRSQDDLDLRIRYEEAVRKAEATKASIATTDRRRFTGKVDTLVGTIDSANTQGVRLKEYPGRFFKFSSIGTTAADLSAAAIAENNNSTKAELLSSTRDKQKRLFEFINTTLKPGTGVHLTVPYGATDSDESPRAVVSVNGDIINNVLVNKGLARFNKEDSGEEAQALHGTLANLLGGYAEELAFAGEDGEFSVLRALPTPYHSKLWQEKTPLAQYLDQEVVGTRMRRWDRPIHDFLRPYARKIVERATGYPIIPEEVQHKRDLNTLVDEMNYLRGLKTGYTNQERRTSIGGNLLASSDFARSTVPGRDKRYFNLFLSETNPDKRAKILKVTSPELAKALEAQWLAAESRIKRAEGINTGPVDENGVIETKEGLDQYKHADTKLGYGDYMRSREIAEFFSRTGFNLPDFSSEEAYSPNLDYEDIKLKIVQNEGYDYHDFDIFDDRANMLWRKPYIEGAVSELTSGNTRSTELLRRAVEDLITRSRNNKNAQVSVSSGASQRDTTQVRMDIRQDHVEHLIKDIRRNPEKYQED